MAVATEAEIPKKNKRRAVKDGTSARRLRKKRRGVLSAAKACKILKDGKVHGKPLTRNQREFFGARCNEE
jgi:hypothetical protein